MRSRSSRAPTHAEIGAAIGALVEEKQRAYGDSFGKTGAAFRLLYPNGIGVEQMEDALCLVRIWDKMMRIATKKNAFGESPYRDLGGYAVLGAHRDEAAAAAARPESAPVRERAKPRGRKQRT